MSLGELEQLILLALVRLEGEGHGAAIAIELEERVGVAPGALYTILEPPGEGLRRGLDRRLDAGARRAAPEGLPPPPGGRARGARVVRGGPRARVGHGGAAGSPGRRDTMSRRPPWAARVLAALVLPPRDREFVLGDLEEIYARRAARGVVRRRCYATPSTRWHRRRPGSGGRGERLVAAPVQAGGRRTRGVAAGPAAHSPMCASRSARSVASGASPRWRCSPSRWAWAHPPRCSVWWTRSSSVPFRACATASTRPSCSSAPWRSRTGPRGWGSPRSTSTSCAARPPSSTGWRPSATCCSRSRRGMRGPCVSRATRSTGTSSRSCGRGRPPDACSPRRRRRWTPIHGRR